MQQSRQIPSVEPDHQPEPSLKVQHLSSFSILNRNGLEIDNGIIELATDDQKEEEKPLSEFSGWSLPLQRAEYFQSKKHDFW